MQGNPCFTLASKPATLGGGWGAVGGIRLCSKHSHGKRHAVSLLLPPQGQSPAKTLQVSPPHLISVAKHPPRGSRRAKALGRRYNLEGGHPGEGLRTPPAWWEQRRDGGQAVPEVVKPRGGLEGSPHHGKPSPATSPCPEMGERNRELHPTEHPPPRLQPLTLSVEGRCSSPASPGVLISSTLIMPVV